MLLIKAMNLKTPFLMVKVFKTHTPQFSVFKRSNYGNDCDFKHQIIEYRGNNCFIPSNGYCFIKLINYVTNSNYEEQYLNFIRYEQNRSNIMTQARIQSCLRKLGINLGY